MTSPFISDTRVQWAWDSTSLGWLKECPRKYYYHMIEGWTSKSEAVDLKFGILYHGALEDYDKCRFQGQNHDEAVKTVIHNVLHFTWGPEGPWRNSTRLDPEDKKSLKCREHLVRTIVWYLDKFRDDPAKTKIGPNGPMVELHFQFDTGLGIDWHAEYTYNLCGHLDRVVEFQGEPFVMDRKSTTTTLGSYYFEQYDPDNQMSLYTIASQVAFHTPVKGVIIDAAQIAIGFSRFVRSIIYRTPDQIDEWMKDLKVWLIQAEQYADANHWPMNDKSCHKYGGCVFRGICSKSPSVRDKFLESNFERREWNPLVAR